MKYKFYSKITFCTIILCHTFHRYFMASFIFTINIHSHEIIILLVKIFSTETYFLIMPINEYLIIASTCLTGTPSVSVIKVCINELEKRLSMKTSTLNFNVWENYHLNCALY